MKAKLEVVETSINSIKFGFGNIGTIFRLGWLGALLYVIVYAGGILLSYGVGFFGAIVDGEITEVDAMTSSMAFQSTSWLFGLIASFMVVPFTVAIRRIAAGEIEPPRGIAYFRIGGREIKFFLSQIIIAIIIALFAAVVLIPALIAFMVSVLDGVSVDMLMQAETGASAIENTVEQNVADGVGAGMVAGIVLAIIGVIAIIWFSIRACLFTTAAAIEDKLLPFGSLGLTGGNVWRIVGAFILLCLMVMMLYLLFAIGVGIVAAILVGIAAASGEASGVLAIVFGIIGGIGGVVLLIAFICVAVGIEQSFPAKIYASITRGTAEPAPHEDAA